MNPTFQLVDRGWDKVLGDAVNDNCTELRVVCPFIKTRTAKRLLASKCPELIQVITRFHLGEMCAGVNDTGALRLLLENGAKIRGVQGLHAKLYLFGDSRAVVTSANLTEAALLRNHEFGFVTSEGHIIQRCREYFDALWKKSGVDLDVTRLNGWEKRIETVRLAGAPPTAGSDLADEGTNADMVGRECATISAVDESTQFFVKILGEGDNRASLEHPVLEEVKNSGTHWACSYPKKKRPRRVQDGDIMFMGRLVENPHDTIIYGVAIGVRHVEGRDEATPEEIEFRNWKKQWPIYVRVHHAEFVAGTLSNGVRLSKLMHSLGSDAFLSTQNNARLGRGNTNPRSSLRQQAQVQLTREGFQWIQEHLESSFAKHGKLQPAELDKLDWPQ